ncbi:MAG TPA: hypothetical protein DDW31_02330 [candidate division Zixibacteria bacterium]|jgi:putative two-component system response regulator|nr:hypothetical protein [candidate division Zixibacteria bacterium]
MKNVLIVDDEKSFLSLLEEGFKASRQDFKVSTAENGRQAVEHLRSNQVDLVVTDIKMPQMDGFELLSYLKESHPNVPVILMTAFGTHDIEERLRAMGASQYLEKPLDFEMLAGKIVEELAETMSRQVKEDPGARPKGRKTRVLACGPHFAVPEQVAALLDPKDFAVKTAERLWEVPKSVQAERPEVILLSVPREQDMADLKKAVEEIQSQNPLRPVILLAEDANPPRMLDFWRLGASDLVLRARAVQELVPAIDRSLRNYQQAKAYFTSQLRVSYETEIKRLHSEMSDELNRILNLEDELSGVSGQMIKVLVNAVEIGDPYVRGHSERVASRAKRIVDHMNQGYLMSRGVMDAGELEMACLLHDIGKLGVPDSVLNQRHQLSDSEWSLIRRHPHLGAEIVANIGQLHGISPDIRHHHERWDGGGYPDGLKGDDIPIKARVIAVADAFDAMASPRVYRQPMPLPVIVDEIRKQSGSQFDPQVVDGLMGMVGEM